MAHECEKMMEEIDNGGAEGMIMKHEIELDGAALEAANWDAELDRIAGEVMAEEDLLQEVLNDQFEHDEYCGTIAALDVMADDAYLAEKSYDAYFAYEDSIDEAYAQIDATEFETDTEALAIWNEEYRVNEELRQLLE